MQNVHSTYYLPDSVHGTWLSPEPSLQMLNLRLESSLTWPSSYQQKVDKPRLNPDVSAPKFASLHPTASPKWNIPFLFQR